MNANCESTVFVVDDDDAMRRLIRNVVELANLPTELYSSAQAFLDAFDTSRAGCLVTDVKMPGMTGVELQEALAAKGAVLPVIIVTGHGDISIAVRAMKALAVDVLEKPFRPDQLLARIEQALEVDRTRRAAQAQRAALSERFQALSDREREVMCLVVSGLANKQIAYRLELSEKTIEAHRSRMMKKLGVVSVAELVRLALAAGAVEDSPVAGVSSGVAAS
jgi:RNA polymerase sigma factor (sigma-70 family)